MLSKIISKIDRVETYLSATLIAGITLVMGYQVVMRYVFRNPPTWTQELAMLMLIYLSYVSADIVFRRKGHIGIDFFVNRFPANVRSFANVLVNVFLCIVLSVIFYHSVVLLYIQAGHDIAGVLPFSKSFWILPVSLTFPSMALTGIESVREAFRMRNADRNGAGEGAAQ